jgi:hypothetical protein
MAADIATARSDFDGDCSICGFGKVSSDDDSEGDEGAPGLQLATLQLQQTAEGKKPLTRRALALLHRGS